MKKIIILMMVLISSNLFAKNNIKEFNKLLSELASIGSNIEGFHFSENESPQGQNFTCNKVISGNELFLLYKSTIKVIESESRPIDSNKNYSNLKTHALHDLNKKIKNKMFHYCQAEELINFSRIKTSFFVNQKLQIYWEIGYEN